MSSQPAKATRAFLRGAPRYWLRVYPQVCAEVAHQRAAASAIPDPQQRGAALLALARKRGNVDGAAAFAAFVAPSRRAAVVRAQVAFQALYDYLDVLTELPHPDPVSNSRALHVALSAALTPPAGEDFEPGPDSSRTLDPAQASGSWAPVFSLPPIPGYAGRADAGYVADTVSRCRDALSQLPSYEAVRPSVQRLGQHIVDFQSFNVTDAAGPRAQLARWAQRRTPARSQLRWWEIAASAGSSLGIFALLALAARPRVSEEQALALERTYFPWIGALHSLLDSLIDVEEDAASGQPSLIAEYASSAEAVERLRLLATESRARAGELPNAGAHLAVLAGMASLYLVEERAHEPLAREACKQVLEALGTLAVPSLFVLRVRRTLTAGSG